jgi:hypothetical protein
MTNEKKTIEMAHEAGLHVATDVNWMPIIGLEYAEKLIAVARADEREACAYRAGIALLGADRGLANRVNQAIQERGQA